MRNFISVYLATSAIISAIASSSLASNHPPGFAYGDKTEPYVSYKDIPIELIEQVYPTQTLQEYIDSNVAWASSHGLLNNEYGIPEHVKKFADKLENHQEELVLQYDYNKDGRVTMSEVKAHPPQSPRELETLSMNIPLLKQLDKNRDFEISPSEMKIKATAYIQELRSSRTKYHEIASIVDIDQNQLVSAEDLHKVSVKIFATLDSNRNAVLDAHEIQTLSDKTTASILDNKRPEKTLSNEDVRILAERLMKTYENLAIFKYAGKTIQGTFNKDISSHDFFSFIDSITAASSSQMSLERLCWGKNCREGPALLFEATNPSVPNLNLLNIQQSLSHIMHILEKDQIDLVRLDYICSKGEISIEIPTEQGLKLDFLDQASVVRTENGYSKYKLKTISE